jgi:hypothetical protein
VVHTNDEFIADPTGHMIAVIDVWRRAELAEQALESEGFEEVRLYRGREGVRAIDSDGEQHGLANYLLRLVQHGLTDKDHLGEYEDAVRQGASVISFRVGDADEEHERAATILERAGARAVNYFGPFVVETVKP